MTIKQSIPTLLICAVALFLIICGLDRCRCNEKGINLADSTIHVSNYQKSIFDKEVKVSKEVQKVYIDRWRTITKQGDTIFVHVYHAASDSCKTLLDSLNKQRKIEQNAAQLVIKSDSITIAALDSLNKVNDILIGEYKGKVVLLSDTIKKVKRRNYWRGLRDGIIIGGAAVEMINLIK